MNLEDLVQPTAWMTQEEHQTTANLVAAFQGNFASRHLPEDPFLTIRLRYLLLHLTLCRRLEQSVLGDSKDLTPAAAAHIGKALERLRKALKDLEDTANRIDPAAHHALPPSGKKAPQIAAPRLASPQATGPIHLEPDSTKKVQSPVVPPPPSSVGPTTPTCSPSSASPIGRMGPISPILSPAFPPNPTRPMDHLRAALQPALHVSKPLATAKRIRMGSPTNFK